MNRTEPSSRQALSLADATLAQPYSDAVWQQDMAFLSGRVGLGDDGVLATGGIAEETAQALANIAKVLELAGLTLDHVLRVTVYLLTMGDYAEMNRVYTAAFAKPLPARTCVAVAGLPLGARVEIEVTARRDAV